MSEQKKHPARGIAMAGVIAALYVVITWLISRIPGFATSAIQVRVSEALCILTFFTPWAVPGLTIGCLLANVLVGLTDGLLLWQDVVFGTLATLIGAIGGRMLRKVSVWLVPVPTVIANAIIVPFVLVYGYHIEGTLPLFMVTVGVGELIAAFGLGMALYFALKPHEKRLFGKFQ